MASPSAEGAPKSAEAQGKQPATLEIQPGTTSETTVTYPELPGGERALWLETAIHGSGDQDRAAETLQEKYRSHSRRELENLLEKRASNNQQLVK